MKMTNQPTNTHRATCVNRILTVIFAACICLATSVVQVLAEPYTLQPQDQVRLRVMQWVPTVSRFQTWEGLSGDFALDSEGRLSLPLVGIISVLEMSVDEVGDTIAREIQLRTGNADRVNVGVELIGHRPVYVLGAVRQPGAVKFEPGLTGQQALALAGGVRRLLEDDQRVRISDLFQAEGNALLLERQLNTRLELRQRIQAEYQMLEGLSGEDEPDSTTTTGHANDLTELSQRILDSSIQAKTQELEALSNLEAFLTEQINGLGAQRNLLAEQIEREAQELDNVSSLREQGLTVNSRLSSLANSLTSLKSDAIQLDVALLNAQQQLSRVQRDSANVVTSSRGELLQRMSENDAEISLLETRLASAELVFLELSASALNGQISSQQRSARETVFRMTRIVGGEPVTTEISGHTQLAPGDTIEVVIVLDTDQQ